MPRKAPPIEQKESRDAILDEQSPYCVASTLFFKKIRPESREPGDPNILTADGRRTVGKIKRGDSINLALVYLAYCNHAGGKLHEAFPSYSRVATLCGVTVKTVERALHTLCERGLLKIDRPRWIKGGKGHVNVVRVVHDPDLSTNDEKSIASYQTNRHHVVRNASSSNGHHDVALGNSNRHPPPENPTSHRHHDVQPLADNMMSDRTVLTKNLTGQALNGTQCERVLTYWSGYAKGKGVPIVENEEDQGTGLELQDRGIPEETVRQFIRFHYDMTDPEQAHRRLKPIVAGILQAHVQSSNGR